MPSRLRTILLILAVLAAGCSGGRAETIDAEAPAPNIVVADASSAATPSAETRRTETPRTETSNAAGQTATPVSPAAVAGGQVARAQTSEGLLSIDLTTGRSLPSLNGLPNADWSVVAGIENGKVTFTDLRTGQKSQAVAAPGNLQPSAVSADGRLLALSDFGQLGPKGVPSPKSTTRLAVAERGSSVDPQILAVRGNMQPEAFSSDGRYIFVLDYVPADAPDHYEVRAIDRTTGKVLNVGARIKEADTEQMQGIPRTSVYSADRKMLFTLYSQYDAAHAGHAFIHALYLGREMLTSPTDAGWSFCIDLPHTGDFGTGQPAMTLAADGRSLVVVSNSGAVAAVDTEPMSLRVQRTTTVTPKTANPLPAPSVAATDAGVMVAVGNEVFVLDALTLKTVTRLPSTEPVIGLAKSSDNKVAVARKSGIEVVQLPGGASTLSVAAALAAPFRFVVT